MLRKTISFLRTPVGVSLLLAFLVIGIAFVVKTKTSNEGPEKGPAALAVEKLIKKSLEDDTDGDGLKNWEEALYKTDPETADSDGDGVNDGAEIATNRDPLVVGVGEGATKTSATSTMKFTATDRFSQEIFMRYLEAKSSGQEITQEFSEKIAEEILTKDYDLPVSEFDANTLLIITKPTVSQIYEYGNIFGKIISKPVPNGVRTELVILESIQNQGLTEADISELQVLYERYTSLRDSLIAMKVPSDIKNTHVAFIRAIDILRDSVLGMQNLETDPIGALKKIALYEEALNQLSLATVNLKQYFVSKKITFSSYESGSVIMQ